MNESASSPSAGRGQTKKRVTSPASSAQTSALSAARLDELHDGGEDLSRYLDVDNATRPGRKVQRVNVDFPVDLLRALDREAKRIGVSRQALIKLRLADSLSFR